ncbi:S-layer homology domain-containing protein [Domibacillus epiphyticus]|uniref:SLH domain-containing protein n=1 Tax=Domibacillus epiphyticus TaxID=1714355 RepID=A0A1V2A5G3_9BACI|nr:S-layer homology domain-containing protein [Domibacillus epiphyticus]OMP66177.1 hypothetical protein BTO28_13735 [Domibacillus epiphyticus]
MNKFARLVAATSFCVSFLFSSSVSSAATFKDVTSFKQEIEYLAEKGVINGFNDQTFRSHLPIKRVHAVQMIIRALKPPLENVPDPGFTDVKPTDAGFKEIAAAVQLGIISGKNASTFDPTGNLTRAEMSKILSNAYELGGMYPKGFTDVNPAYWAYPYISSLAANNITVGYPDGSFKPGKTIDRGQFSAFMARILEPSFQPYNPGIADTLLEAALHVQPTDYEQHPAEPVIYYLDPQANEVTALNYETYEESSIKLPLPAERMTFANGKLYVTLLKGTHQHVWDEADQKGAFAVIDTSLFTLSKVVDITLDPYDIAADDNGIVYISGGSDQHTSLISVDSQTGEELSKQGITYRSLIQMHPSQNRLYAITTSVSPRDTASYRITGGKLEAAIDSPYHGDYPLSPDITMSPDGKYLFNQSGHIFTLSETPSADMIYFTSLKKSFTSLAFDVNYGELYAAYGSDFVQAYDYDTLGASYQLKTYGNVQKMFYDSNHHRLILFTKVKLAGTNAPLTGIENIYFDVSDAATSE